MSPDAAADADAVAADADADAADADADAAGAAASALMLLSEPPWLVVVEGRLSVATSLLSS